MWFGPALGTGPCRRLIIQLPQGGPQLPQQGRELLASPAHPGPVVLVIGGFPTGGLAVERAGVRVVAQLHGPGEMVVELHSIHAASLHDFADQADEALPHAGMGRVQPDHRAAMQRVAGAAVPFGQHPIGLATHHVGISRLHQPVLKPRNHLQTAALGSPGHPADRIQVGIRLLQRRLQRRPAAAVEGGTPAPHVGVERVEAGLGQFADGLLDQGWVVVEGAGAIGKPDADAPGGLAACRWPCCCWHSRRQQAGQHQIERGRQQCLQPAETAQGLAVHVGRTGEESAEQVGQRMFLLADQAAPG